MVITGLGIIAALVAVVVAAVVAVVAWAIGLAFTWDSDKPVVLLYLFAAFAGILAGWGAWELVYKLASTTIQVKTGG